MRLGFFLMGTNEAQTDESHSDFSQLPVKEVYRPSTSDVDATIGNECVSNKTLIEKHE